MRRAVVGKPGGVLFVGLRITIKPPDRPQEITQGMVKKVVTPDESLIHIALQRRRDQRHRPSVGNDLELNSRDAATSQGIGREAKEPAFADAKPKTRRRRQSACSQDSYQDRPALSFHI